MNTDLITPANVAGLAQSQYYKRPGPERFEDIVTLQEAVEARQRASVEYVSPITDMRFEPSTEHGLVVVPRRGEIVVPTHYSFGQSARLLGAPAQWLRMLGEAGQHELAAKNLNTALALRKDKFEGDSADTKVLVIDGDDHSTLQALTSKTYGRIWDADVVRAVRRLLDARPEYENPKEWGGKRGGLYASDRDIFLFFVNGGSIVDGGRDLLNGGDRDQLFRGFMVANSEVGSATFMLIAFLFRMVCGNHMIHGIEGTRMLKIRHTSGGPERFINEALPALQEYTEASARPLEEAVRKAKELLLPKGEKEFVTFFTAKGFTKAEVRRAKTFAEAEEGGADTLWQMQQGLTRAARDVAHMDARTDLERRAGKLFELVSDDAVSIPKLVSGDFVEVVN